MKKLKEAKLPINGTLKEKEVEAVLQKPRILVLEQNINQSIDRFDGLLAKTMTLMGSTKDEAIYCGTLLEEVSQEIGHGGFLNWIRNSFRKGQSTAYNWMKLAKEHRKDPKRFEDCHGSTKALQLCGILREPSELQSKFKEENPLKPDPLIGLFSKLTKCLDELIVQGEIASLDRTMIEQICHQFQPIEARMQKLKREIGL